MTIDRRHFTLGLAGSAALLAAPASAQTFPSKPINLVVPFAPGGSTDVVARIIAAKMSENMGTQVIVENRAGAGGGVGAAAVAKATPDGHTILMATISTHTLNPLMAKTRLFDPIKDFRADLAARHRAERASRASLTRREQCAGADRAPEEGAGQAQLRLLGQRHAAPCLGRAVQAHDRHRHAAHSLSRRRAGHERPRRRPGEDHVRQPAALRAADPRRHDQGARRDHQEARAGFENIPTIAEQGLPDYETYSWNGFLAPAGTPPAVIAKLNAEANKAIADPGVKAKLTDISAVTVGTTPEELAAFIQKELAIWEPVIRGANITID